MESAITEIVPGPGPLAWAGLIAGIVSAGGASTGGREPATGSRVGDGAGGCDGDGDGTPRDGGTAPVTGFGWDRGAGDGARVGAAVGVGTGDP